VNNLVNCRFVEEVTAALDTLQSKNNAVLRSKKELCTLHDTELNYYCNTCRKAICSDCAMFGEEHRSHQFERLAVVYGRHVEQIKSESVCLLKRLQELGEHIGET
jgi:tripartite motif-containing protein 37